MTLRRDVEFAIFFLLAVAVFFVPVPYVTLPIKWFETHWHETAHGFAAWLVGGSVASYNLDLKGSGSVVSLIPDTALSRGFVSVTGYPGASLFGALIYLVAGNFRDRTASILCVVIAALFGLWIPWAEDAGTVAIIACYMAFLIAVARWAHHGAIPHILRFLGMYCMAQAIVSPTYLWTWPSGQRGDATNMSASLLLPESLWILLWIGLGIGVLLLVFRNERRASRRSRLSVAERGPVADEV